MAVLRVIEIFDSLQGEGYWTGTPMTFVRLAGCNAPELGLGCVRWCDTPESWDPAASDEMTIAEVMRRVSLPRLCLTGGEPLLQTGVADLLTEAHHRNIRVHVETNGRVALLADADDDGFDWVCVGPKPPGYAIAPEWRGRVDELKLVADEGLDAATAERVAATHPEAAVFIQPEHGAGREGWGRAVELVMSHPDWRLSLQIHKLLGMR
jgi:organic radical activating enzyme